MNKQDLINAVVEKAQGSLTKSEAGNALDALAEVVQAELAEEGGEVTLPGIGKLKLSERAARTARNPKTGQSVEVPAKTVVKFSVAKALADAVA